MGDSLFLDFGRVNMRKIENKGKMRHGKRD